VVSIVFSVRLGSLSNHYGDGNESGKKQWYKQNNISARASIFLYISLPSLHDYNEYNFHYTISEFQELSLSNQGLVPNLSCENEFKLYENKKLFSYQ